MRECQLRFPPIGNDRIMIPAESGASARNREEGHVPEETGARKVYRIADCHKAAKF